MKGNLTLGQVEVIPTRSWREEGGVIYFSVTSPLDVRTGEEWITRLESKGLHVDDYAKQVLRSPDFKPTNGMTTEVAVLKGRLFKDEDRTMKKIRAEADKRKLMKPNVELACLIREKFTDREVEQMCLLFTIIAMHEPINDSDGNSILLGMSRAYDGGLYACDGNPNRWLSHILGFAFAVSK